MEQVRQFRRHTTSIARNSSYEANEFYRSPEVINPMLIRPRRASEPDSQASQPFVTSLSSSLTQDSPLNDDNFNKSLGDVNNIPVISLVLVG
ncbi:hypothetical protein RirG_236970 [Rhizophagus irregularis DAOM 197198w]|uniref:Uncharacterized protein n=1 Tax=Rhizophagus irregularis (strain DAOM 197198w) TaxID=1432141 RepID=A0A015K446_RHIIW|nr:hypothetical protein RirG_236970 [Rhizophagus irregularis DAOM 197198w]